MAELMYKIANAKAPDIRLVQEGIPPSLAEVVASALAKEPEARFQDGDQFAAALRRATAQPRGTAADAPVTSSYDAIQNAQANPMGLAAARTAVVTRPRGLGSSSTGDDLVHPVAPSGQL